MRVAGVDLTNVVLKKEFLYGNNYLRPLNH